MPIILNSQTIPIAAAGANISLDVAAPIEKYNIVSATGSPITLAGNVTIAPTGTPVQDMVFDFSLSVGATLGAFVFSIFGRALLPNEALSNCQITAWYNNGAWEVDVVLLNNAINDSKVKADVGDPTADYLTGKVEDSIEVDTATHKLRLKGDVNSPLPYRFYSTDAFGVKGMNPLPPSQIFYQEVTLTHAQILTLNSVPVVAIPAPGAGYAIATHLAVFKAKVWSAAYGTNWSIELIPRTAVSAQVSNSNILLFTTVGIVQNPAFQYGGFNSNIIENKDLMIDVQSGDPTGGDPANVLVCGIFFSIIPTV